MAAAGEGGHNIVEHHDCHRPCAALLAMTMTAMLGQSQCGIAEVGKAHTETGLPGSVDRVGQLRWDSLGQIDLFPCLRHVLFLDPALALAGEHVAARQAEEK